MLPVLIHLFGFLLCAFGAWQLARQIRTGNRAQMWPVTSGKISRSWVAEELPGDVEEGYAPSVQYDYDVNGRTYQGTAIRAYRWRVGSAERAARSLEGLQVGATVSVYYDPARPERALLQPGVSLPVYLLAAVLVGFTFFFAYRLLQFL